MCLRKAIAQCAMCVSIGVEYSDLTGFHGLLQDFCSVFGILNNFCDAI